MDKRFFDTQNVILLKVDEADLNSIFGGYGFRR